MVIANTLFQQHNRWLCTWPYQMVTIKIVLIILFAAEDGEVLYSQQKWDKELTVAQIMNSILPNSDLIEESRKTTRQFSQFSSVAQSCLTRCNLMNHSTPGFLVYHQHPKSTQTHVHRVSDAIQPSHPLSSPSPPALNLSEHQMSQLFTSGGQSIGVSASTSVFPMNTQDWSSLGWTGWISLLSKGLSRVFSNTTVQKHQFFGPQLSLYSNSHIHTWPLEKP